MHSEEPNLEPASHSALSVSHAISRGSLRWWMLLILVWCIGGGYAGVHLKRGWVPHDEGAFAQSADRVLHGELPHRDYTDVYTGGLAFLHAFAFRYLGEDLATLRIVLFVFFLIWIPVFYWIASRMVSDWIAGGVTLLAVAWSLPNYSAAVPSWYNLFFATFGVAALFAYLSDRVPKWLFIAGLCGGCSFLAKDAAFYYVAGVLVFLVFSEQCESFSTVEGAKTRSLLYTAFVVFSIVLFLAGLAALIREHGTAEEITNFVAPPSLLATLVLLREARATSRSSRERFLALFRTTLPFGLGFLTPLFVFLIPYLRGNGLHAVLRGVLLLPFKRVWGAFQSPPPLSTIAPLICVIGIFALGAWFRGMARWLLSCSTGLVFVYYLISSAHNIANYQIAWHTAYWVTPMLVLTGVFALRRGSRWGVLSGDPLNQRQLFLILAVTALCSLVQYPFSAPIYFCYVAPLAILGAVAVLRAFPSIPQPLLGTALSGFLLFAVLRVAPPYIYALGYYYQADPETHILDLPRAGSLRVQPESAKIYEQLIPLIQQHAVAGEIYAAPDCPEIYFLTGYRNPTRALFDFLEDDYGDSGHILRLVDSRPIHVIVLSKHPSFSAALPVDAHKALVMRFREGKDIGDFEVRWRE